MREETVTMLGSGTYSFFLAWQKCCAVIVTATQVSAVQDTGVLVGVGAVASAARRRPVAAPVPIPPPRPAPRRFRARATRHCHRSRAAADPARLAPIPAARRPAR